eukprot:CAMPEP_0203918836 /NCGR_PEP_ID=MMETSP0359-20131031/59335_1 /ASSEMBLY_ACC=CAM_ASM_000338 /TAXON_ID=268821 /ORGANISM="Scrippsiella Hangoei, Strain SHTV-5" /LENGTH=170 /DNA_ID=CAMNT_0050846011 /DNA_START=9 /DNA_END=521 /DNA_ORIENTATION=+
MADRSVRTVATAAAVGAVAAVAALAVVQWLQRQRSKGPFLRKTLSVPGAPPPLARYLTAVAIAAGARTLHISGQVGAKPDGTLPEIDEEQCQLAFANIGAVLAHHGVGFEALVKVTVFALPGHCSLAAYRKAREGALGDMLCASSLIFVAALATEAMVVEIEAVAALPPL